MPDVSFTNNILVLLYLSINIITSSSMTSANFSRFSHALMYGMSNQHALEISPSKCNNFH
ncbi:hypothetical protein ACW9JY_08680 [Petrotoga sp. DB-2]